MKRYLLREMHNIPDFEIIWSNPNLQNRPLPDGGKFGYKVKNRQKTNTP